MSTSLCIILFVVFALAQLLLAKKSSHKIIKHIPMISSALLAVFSIGLHIYTLIIYNMKFISSSVLAENQYFATFLLIPAGICLVGSVVGLGISKIKK